MKKETYKPIALEVKRITSIWFGEFEALIRYNSKSHDWHVTICYTGTLLKGCEFSAPNESNACHLAGLLMDAMVKEQKTI